MKSRPILFSAPMVRALLAGTKTQTRRIVKPQPPASLRGDGWHDLGDRRCPYGSRGDRLWVRETWYCDDYTAPDFVAAQVGYVTPRTNEEIVAEWRDAMYYRADTRTGLGKVCELIPECMCDGRSPWRPGIHMPRWASRIELEVTAVRVERLQAITEEDARAEGVEPFPAPREEEGDCWTDGKRRTAFEYLWNEINGWNPNSWQSNPWVWVVEFRRLEVTA